MSVAELGKWDAKTRPWERVRPLLAKRRERQTENALK